MKLNLDWIKNSSKLDEEQREDAMFVMALFSIFVPWGLFPWYIASPLSILSVMWMYSLIIKEK